MSRTGRPRNAEADLAILDATRSALVDVGWGKLTMGLVATRAGVAKTTLYRRWANKNELVLEAVAALFDQLRPPDRGNLAADVEGLVMEFGTLLDRPETKTALMAVVAEATHDEALRLKIRQAIVDRQKRLVKLGRERAQARGELPLDSPDEAGAQAAARNTDLIFDVIAGAVVHRTLVSGKPVDTGWARTFTALLTGGLPAAMRRIRSDEAAEPRRPATTQKRAGSV